MPISDMPIFSMLRTRMQWHQERQRVLAENVANADTPKFRPRDLKPLDFGRAGAGGRRRGSHARQHQPGAHHRLERRAARSRPSGRANTTYARPATR